MSNAITLTGAGIARLMNYITQDGHVNEKEEAMVQKMLETQQGCWNVMIVVDTLICAVTLPLLIFEEVGAPEPELLSTAVADKVIWAYLICVSFAFYCASFQGTMAACLYMVTSYLRDKEALLFFYMKFAKWISFLNMFLFPIAMSTMAAAALGNMLLVGFYKALPSIVMCATAMTGMMLFYFCLLKGTLFRTLVSRSSPFPPPAADRSLPPSDRSLSPERSEWTATLSVASPSEALKEPRQASRLRHMANGIPHLSPLVAEPTPRPPPPTESKSPPRWVMDPQGYTPRDPDATLQDHDDYRTAAVPRMRALRATHATPPASAPRPLSGPPLRRRQEQQQRQRQVQQQRIPESSDETVQFHL